MIGYALRSPLPVKRPIRQPTARCSRTSQAASSSAATSSASSRGDRHWGVVHGVARQQRRRPVVAQAFEGRAVRRLRGAHASDEQGLAVVVFVHADAKRVAHGAARAVGRHDKAGTHRPLAIGIGDAQCAMTCVTGRETDEARRTVSRQPRHLSQSRFQRLAEVTRHDHLAEGITTIVLRIQFHAPEVALAADVDAPDRAGGRAQLLHDAERCQCIDRRRGEAEVALVEHRGHLSWRGSLHQAHVQSLPVQGDGQAGTDQSATHDHHVMPFFHAAMIALRLRRPVRRHATRRLR